MSVEEVVKLAGKGAENVNEATPPAQVAAVIGPKDVGALGTVVVVVRVAVLVERLAALKVVAVTLMLMTTVEPTGSPLGMVHVTVVVPEQEPPGAFVE